MRLHANALRTSRRNHTVVGAGLVATAILCAMLVAAGCSGDGGSEAADTNAPTAASEKAIPQPVVEDVQVAPESERVDLASPTFSDPTNVSNPLFPVAKQKSVLLLGEVDGEPFRTEVTLLNETRIVEWQGQQVETLVSQYVAYLSGRIHEVALDFYAQDDDGAVWYFGEDVFNFKDGLIADTHGTWIAGKDGPAAMIMPADPQVGDVYRPENIPGFVFEEVVVKGVGETVDGPLGPVEGVLVIEELHMDNSTEAKTFAPGYGEFFTGGGGDVEALALAVPTDALSAPAPQELVDLENGAGAIFAAAPSRDWAAAQGALEQMNAAWTAYKAGDVPDRLEPELSRDLQGLAVAVRGRKPATARQAAVDVARWSLDLQLRHRPVVEVDLARLDLWLAQMLLDAAAGDGAAVTGDFFSLDYIRDRVQHALPESDRTRLNAGLEELNAAVADNDAGAAADVASQLRETVADMKPAG